MLQIIVTCNYYNLLYLFKDIVILVFKHDLGLFFSFLFIKSFKTNSLNVLFLKGLEQQTSQQKFTNN